MPSLKAIRKRITSVKNTRKITSAMKLVAGARLRRAQEGIWAARPYAASMQQVIAELAARAGAEAHPLLTLRDEKRVSLIAITSDRGLCGAFNSNINRRTERFLVDNSDRFTGVVFNIVGKKGREYFRRRKVDIKREWSAVVTGEAALARAKEIANEVTTDFLDGDVDAVYLVYNEFKSAISQRVTVEPLLPVQPIQLDEEHGLNDFKYEPSRAELLSHIVPLHIEVQIYRALLESIASEFGARMSAMDSATRNASEMIGALTLQFNRARQAAITKELMEIIGGAEALKG
jgi:F-type H+-transporting ATPase subunit gamma